MQNYIGVKLIMAEPMTNAQAYEKKTGEKSNIEKYPEQEGYRVVYQPDGYASWSPKDVFEEAYRPTNGLTFGLAVEALKKGFKVDRVGWNGKGMFVYYVPPNYYKTQTEVAKKEFGDIAPYNAYLAIKNVNGTVSTWVPSINDCLAEDWQIIN